MCGLICAVVAGLLGSSPTFVQGLQKPVCMENPGGDRSCLYDSFPECQQATASRSAGTDYVANPERFSTTGQGGIGSSPNPNSLPPSR